MRNKRIDLLRFIGLSWLILGHVNPPDWLFQLRNYNVPLLILASAIATAEVGLKSRYWDYVWKRVKRLVFPAWLFLTFYFLFLWFTGLAPMTLTAQNIWNNYTFSNDGGYMWIIRIFLLLSLIVPLIDQANKKIRSTKLYLGLLLVTYIVYESLLYLLDNCPDNRWTKIIDAFLCYSVGYGVVFALGLRLTRLTSKELWSIGGLSFCVFAALAYLHYLSAGHLVQTQWYKYPPSAYYLSYAIVASLVTWWIAKFICAYLEKASWLEGVVMFAGQNTLWIYLWHTIFVLVSYRMHGQNFLAKYFVVYALSILTVFLQVSAVQKWISPRIANESFRRGLKSLFTG